MDRFEEFKTWFTHSADGATKSWAEKRAGSDDVKAVYACLSSLSYVGDGPDGGYPCSLSDISIFKFFPQILGFFHRVSVSNGFRTAEEINGPTPIARGFATLSSLPHVREIALQPGGSSLSDLKNLTNIVSLSISGPLGGDLEFLRGWTGLQSLVLDKISKENFAPPNFRLPNLQKLTIIAPLLQFSEIAKQTNLRTVTIREATLFGELDLSALSWLHQVTFSDCTFTAATLKLPPEVKLDFYGCDLRELAVTAIGIKSARIQSCKISSPVGLFNCAPITSLSMIRSTSTDLSFAGNNITTLKISDCGADEFGFATLPDGLTCLQLERNGIQRINTAPGRHLTRLLIDENLSEHETAKLCQMTFATLQIINCIVPLDFPVQVTDSFSCKRELPSSVSFAQARTAFLQHLKTRGLAEDFKIDSPGKDAYARDPVQFSRSIRRAVVAPLAFIMLFAATVWLVESSAPDRHSGTLSVELWNQCAERQNNEHELMVNCGAEPKQVGH